MTRRPLLAVLLMMFVVLSAAAWPWPSAQILAAETARGTADDSDEPELSLKRFFPEKRLFGPSAGQLRFSHDGRYGAYLYRPRVERRHGNDLWIYDTQTGETRRLTSVSVLAEYQELARKVRDDRIKKAKKAGKKKANGEGDDSDTNGDTENVQDDVEIEIDVAAIRDVLAGVWSGRITGGEGLGIPPDGFEFALTLIVAGDGTIGGELSTPMGNSDVNDAEFDVETGTFSATLRSEDTGFVAALKAEFDNESMHGTISVDTMELLLDISGKRTSAGGPHAPADDDEEDDNGGEEEDLNQGDSVGEKDADDEKAPRYGGVSTYVWSPDANELIFTSGGDLYRLEVDGEEHVIARLTRTEERERDVQYLPDGSGYTYQRGNALIKVSFGSHLLEQIDPRLEDGRRMSGYAISPDGSRLAVLATKGEGYWGRGQKVNIVNYRERFAKVRQVTRHMSDDPFPDFEWSVHLYDFTDHLTEDGIKKMVATHKQSGPRDAMTVPTWSPDSSRVAFAVFEQSSGQAEILEARFVEPGEDSANGEEEEEENATDDDDGSGDEEDADKDATDADASAIEEARLVYKFFHHGGPTTPRMIRPYYLADSRRIAFMTELSGFRHVHVLDPVYEHLKQLTSGRFEVYPIDVSTDHKHLFATATKDDPAQVQVFSIDLETGDMTRLSQAEGVYSGAAVSDDGAHVLATRVDFGFPRELVAIRVNEAVENTLTDSHTEEAKELAGFEPEYFAFENRQGQTIHGHMFKPDDWAEGDQRPLLIYIYGGPLGTQKMITRGAFSAPSYFFAYYMAKKHGYVTCTIDPRGASGYGALFEKSNFEQVGKPQVEDIVDCARWFVDHHGVDEDRMGLHGWSFGGFQTQMTMYTEPEVFACGIAGAGPTEWENYNSWYSTGTIGPSREGKTDLKQFSLLPLAKNLEGELLLVHGMEDSNVLYQDTVRVYRELLKAGKETLVELFLDPTGGHGLGGDVKTINRYRKYEEFLLRCLGTSETPPGEPEVE